MKGLIFTYLLSYGGAVVGVFKPYYGVLAYVALAILKPNSLWFWAVPEEPFSKYVAIGFLLGWLLNGLGSWNFRRGGAVALALGAYWLWTLFGYILAPNLDVAWGYFDVISKILLPAFIGMTMIDSVRKLKQLAWVIVVCEGYVAFEMNLSYLSGFNRIQEVGFGWMDNNCNAIAFVTCLGLAMFLIIGESRWWQKVAASFFALMLAHAVFLAFSRGAMLAMIATGLSSFFLIPNKRFKHYLFFVLAVLVALRMAGNEVQDRFTTTFAGDQERDGSAQLRIQHWKACLQAVRASPILGVGPAHWHLVSPQYGLPSMEAHTLWLQVAAEQGLVGVFLLGLFYFICAKRLWPITRERYPVSDPWLHDAARMTLAAIVGFFVSAQFVSVQALEVPYFVCILGACILKFVSQDEAQKEAEAWAAHTGASATAY